MFTFDTGATGLRYRLVQVTHQDPHCYRMSWCRGPVPLTACSGGFAIGVAMATSVNIITDREWSSHQSYLARLAMCTPRYTRIKAKNIV
jgi:hypothetical protein